MPGRKSAVLTINRGEFLDRPPLNVPRGALIESLNVRIMGGELTNVFMGWDRFGTFTLNGPVRLIANFILRDKSEHLLFATPTDLYRFTGTGSEVAFITPTYATGTVDVSAADPAVVSAVSGAPTWITNGIKAGDQISFGSATANDPAATWYTVATVDTETQITLTTAVAGAPLAGQTYTIRKLFTADENTHWDSVSFLNDASGNDVWFVTNGIDPVHVWPGTGVAAPAAFDVTCTAKHLTVFSNMLILGNITVDADDYPTSILNSTPGAPLVFTTGLGGQHQIHDGADEIKDLVPLSDNLVVYSERHGTLLQFVGDPLVWVFRKAFTGVGPWGERIVADFGDYHQFLGHDTQYRFDGANLTETGNHVWKNVLTERDAARSDLAIHHFNEELGELTWAMPRNSDTAETTLVPPALAWSEYYLAEPGEGFPRPLLRREFPFTATGYFKQQAAETWATVAGTWDDTDIRWNDQSFFAAYPLNLSGDAAGKVWEFSRSQNADGAMMESFVRFGRVALGDGQMRALLVRVYPIAYSPAGGTPELAVRVRLVDQGRKPITEVAEFPLDLALAEGEHFVSPYRRARFMELEFGTVAVDADWALAGYDLDVKPGGRR